MVFKRASEVSGRLKCRFGLAHEVGHSVMGRTLHDHLACSNARRLLEH